MVYCYGLSHPFTYGGTEDPKGNLWLYIWYGVTYRNTNGTWNSIASLEDKYTYAMIIDPDDHVWVSEASTLDLWTWGFESLPRHQLISRREDALRKAFRICGPSKASAQTIPDKSKQLYNLPDTDRIRIGYAFLLLDKRPHNSKSSAW
ncbi:hypothetical protein ACFL5M_06825 [Candidatus Neomarinimicrobiota bacterium]